MLGIGYTRIAKSRPRNQCRGIRVKRSFRLKPMNGIETRPPESLGDLKYLGQVLDRIKQGIIVNNYYSE